MANHTLGTIRGTIEIDYDGAGIVKAVRDVDKVKKSGGDLDKVSDKILGAFGKFAKGGIQLAGALNLAHGAITGVAGALAIIGPLAAAGFATLPGLIASGAAALVVFKLATAGVGKALKAAGGDADKFNAAIAGLSPQAQAFAKALRASMPGLKAFQQGIQDAFFQGTDRQVAGVVKAIQSLQTNAVAVASTMSRVVQNVVQFATSAKSIDSVKAILAGVSAFLDRIGTSLGPLVQAFLGLAAQASVFGGTLGGVVANALSKMVDFLSKVNLQDLFATALPILKSLGSFLSDIAGIAAQLFSVFTTNGGEAAGILAELASNLSDFLNSAQGQSALAALGSAMSAISGAAGQIFLALLQAIAPAIVALAPGVTTLAGQIAGVLVPAINILNPLLTALAGFLADNMAWIGPLAGAVVVLAAGYKTYAAATKAVAAVQTVLQSKMAGAIAVWTLQKLAILGSTAATVANAIVTGTTAVAAWIANTAAVVANRIAVAAGAIAMGVVRAATIAWTAVQWLLNAALSANPIGLVVIAIAALVAGIILAWKHSETFRNIVLATWAAIKAAAKALWTGIVAAFNGIRTGISNALNWIRNFSKTVWNGIVAGIRAYINLYRTIISGGINAAKAVWTNTLNGIRNVAKSIWAGIVALISSYIGKIRSVINGIRSIIATVRNAFNAARQAAANSIGSLLSLVRSIPGRIRSALGGLGSLLFGAGQKIIRGFISGIGSMIGAVRAKAQSVISAVTRFLPGSPAKEGPLSGRGYVLLRARRFMNDFAQGIEDGSQQPRAALLGAVNPLARATVPSGSTGRSGSSSAPPVVTVGGGTRQYTLEIDGRTLTTLVVDAITGSPIAVSKAADEGSRRSAWAGSGR
jgi:hypothetical protein